MKGYIMYKVGGITFKKEYVKNFNELDKSDLLIKYLNFSYGIIASEKNNVTMTFKGNQIVPFK